MKISSSQRTRKQETGLCPSGLAAALAEKIIGQPEAINAIIPYLELYQAGLAPKGRPAGVFLLLGPTGTGKTRTVEVLAEALHGSEKSLLRVDCGEFQMEHEVAKLIGAPPGYLGHRETQPWITQQKLNAVTSERCDLSLLLFDEIEKAAPSMTRLLLGMMDRATLRLGDSSVVNLERTLIFLTSNAGAREIMREILPAFGLAAGLDMGGRGQERRMERAALASLRKKFSPEFLNRIDAVVTYGPLGRSNLESILDLQIRDLECLIEERLGASAFRLEVPAEARDFLLARGSAPEYGARELRRTLERHLTHRLAEMVARDWVEPGGTVTVSVDRSGSGLEFSCGEPCAPYRGLAGRKESPASVQRSVRGRASSGEAAAVPV